MKAKNKKTSGLLQEIQVPSWKWEDVNMDFIFGLRQTKRQYDFIWVVMDRLTKSPHFITVKSTYSVEDYAIIHIDKILSLHGGSFFHHIGLRCSIHSYRYA